MLEICAAELRGAGYAVHLAEDERMPGGGGQQVWSRFKTCRTTETIPVVVVTGNAGASPRAAFLDDAGVSVLEKPVTPGTLVATVDAVIPAPELRPLLRKVRR